MEKAPGNSWSSMTVSNDELKLEILKYCAKLDSKGFVANHDGNISVRVENGILATPSAQAKSSIAVALVDQ